MRLLICGGRFYLNDDHAFAVLDFLHGAQPFTTVMGDTRFAAALLAKKWATGKGVPFSELSRTKPLEPVLPDLVLAFGTSRFSRAAAETFVKGGFRVLDAQTGQEVRASG